jgi:hypothetical protein
MAGVDAIEDTDRDGGWAIGADLCQLADYSHRQLTG